MYDSKLPQVQGTSRKVCTLLHGEATEIQAGPLGLKLLGVSERKVRSAGERHFFTAPQCGRFCECKHSEKVVRVLERLRLFVHEASVAKSTLKVHLLVVCSSPVLTLKLEKGPKQRDQQQKHSKILTDYWKC